MKATVQLSASSYRNYMSIGDVIKTLSDEFPDVTLSKVRFLESEGLIEPERTASGYRRFYESDLAKLRYILRLQRDHFVPLKVIRKRLEHFDPSEEESPETEEPAVAAPPRSRRSCGSPGRRTSWRSWRVGFSMTLTDFINATNLSEDEVKELEEFGLIHSHPLPTGGRVLRRGRPDGRQDRQRLRQVRHPRPPPRMYKNFCEKEAGLFEQVVLPTVPRRRRRTEDAPPSR